MWQMILGYIEYAYLSGGTTKSSQDWVQTESFTYHYSDLEVSGVEDLMRGKLSLYPNPASVYIQVEGELDTGLARIMMYSVTGQVVLNQVLDDGGRIHVGHLSEGIYVIRLVQGDKVKTGKVMIE